MKSPVRDVQILSLGGIIVAGLFVIGLRLWFVQVQMGAYYRRKGRDRSEISVRIPALRGEILDRNGIVLAKDRPSYDADFYLPDVVKGYEKEYGPVPMIEYLAKDENGMFHVNHEPDIVQMFNRTIIPELHKDWSCRSVQFREPSHSFSNECFCAFHLPSRPRFCDNFQIRSDEPQSARNSGQRYSGPQIRVTAR